MQWRQLSPEFPNKKNKPKHKSKPTGPNSSVITVNISVHYCAQL